MRAEASNPGKVVWYGPLKGTDSSVPGDLEEKMRDGAIWERSEATG